jgi:DNA-binding transcriptional LysR family regulator
MRVSKSVISTRVQQLEEHIGAPLFHRNTRNVQLSEVGQLYLAQCAELVSRSDELVNQMRKLKRSVAGRLKIHALPGFVLGHLAEHLHEFHQRYPEISLDLIVNDAVVDPIQAGVDCALQIFNPASEELIGRPLFPVRRVFCATPEYLALHGCPRHPRDLYEHSLGLYSGYPTRDRWIFHGPTDKVALDLQPALRSNSVHLLQEYAAEHAGIVCVPTLVASAPIMNGTFKLVLPEWHLSSFWLSVVYPRSHRGGSKLQLFIDSLVSKYEGEPPWDCALIDAGLIPRTMVE